MISLDRPTEDIIKTQIEKLGFDLSRPKEIAQSVIKLSDHFHNTKSKPTPWNEKWAAIAYLTYFLPLNYLRLKHVIEYASRINFFKNINSYHDFGSGPGTFSLAINEIIKKGYCTEISRTAIELHKLIQPHHAIVWNQENVTADLLSLSYSLNEIRSMPKGWQTYEAIMIVEPSVKDHFPVLLSARQNLIQNGYSIWAPCTHAQKCPLENERDWCHMRLKIEMPDWYYQLEEYLPMKNNTLTYSYLLARKTPSEFAKAGMARVIGDRLDERGKTRQMICRGSEREFVSVLSKNGDLPQLDRGDLLEIPTTSEKKGNEIRLK